MLRSKYFTGNKKNWWLNTIFKKYIIFVNNITGLNQVSVFELKKRTNQV